MLDKSALIGMMVNLHRAKILIWILAHSSIVENGEIVRCFGSAKIQINILEAKKNQKVPQQRAD